jgi:hypothetical protein
MTENGLRRRSISFISSYFMITYISYLNYILWPAFVLPAFVLLALDGGDGGKGKPSSS